MVLKVVVVFLGSSEEVEWKPDGFVGRFSSYVTVNWVI